MLFSETDLSRVYILAENPYLFPPHGLILPRTDVLAEQSEAFNRTSEGSELTTGGCWGAFVNFYTFKPPASLILSDLL